jgi:phage tail sheath protein FI
MTQPTYGLVFNRTSAEPRPAIYSDMSVIGLVLPSNDADPERFPLNTPVEFNSSDQTYLEDMGTGPLYDAVAAINAQLDDFQVAARMVVVRVLEDDDIDNTIVNIIGSQQNGSGLYALLSAGERLGVIPRIIGTPGYTGRFNRTAATIAVARTAKPGGNTGNGLMTLAGTPYVDGVQNGPYLVRFYGGAKLGTSTPKVGGNAGNGTLTGLTVDVNADTGAWVVTCQSISTNGGLFSVVKPDGTVDGVAIVGTAYNSANGPNFTINDGATDFAIGDAFNIAVAHAIPANGGSFTVKDPQNRVIGTGTVGVPFETEIAFTISDGANDFAIGDGFDVTVVKSGGTAEANPIVAALPAILAPLTAHAVAGIGGPGVTKQDTIDWRETINSDRIIPVSNRVKVLDGNAFEYRDIAAYAMGIGVRTDYLHGGIPSHSWANQPIQGILGLERFDAFSLTDGATAAQELLSYNIGVVVRGELGVESAAANSGFIFIGTDNAGSDALWQFYSVTRMRDFIHLGLMRLLRQRLGVSNITPRIAQAIQNDINNFLSNLKYDEHILGYRVGFDEGANSPEELRLGNLRVFFRAEEAPVLRKITVDSMRYRPALTTLLDDLISQANTVVA